MQAELVEAERIADPQTRTARIVALRYEWHDLREALLEREPLPSAQREHSRPYRPWTPPIPGRLSFGPALETQLEMRLMNRFRVPHPETILQAQLLRVNLARQLRRRSTHLAETVAAGGFEGLRSQLLAAEILSRDRVFSDVTVVFRPEEAVELRGLLSLHAAAALAADDIVTEFSESAPLPRVDVRSREHVEQMSLTVSSLLSFIARRTGLPRAQVVTDMRGLANRPESTEMTLGQATNAYLRAMDPMLDVNTLVDTQRFAYGD